MNPPRPFNRGPTVKPFIGCPQSDWQEWFETIRGLLDSFPSMPSELSISCLTAQIKPHNQRIYGWTDKCAFLQHQQGKYSMADWLDHVQDQVISTATTRTSAYTELMELVFSF